MNSRQTKRYGLLGLCLAAVIGSALVLSFNWAVEATNTEEFCLSCHEMRNTPYVELQQTKHYNNSSGIKVTCPDCHIPIGWLPMMERKIVAFRELWHTWTGRVDTPIKFQIHRPQMAEIVWERMRANDSANCRHCHSEILVKLELQRKVSQNEHKYAVEEGMTCIDCHKGISHKSAERHGSEGDVSELNIYEPDYQ